MTAKLESTALFWSREPSGRATRSRCWIEARSQLYQAPRHRENSGLIHWQNLIIPSNGLRGDRAGTGVAPDPVLDRCPPSRLLPRREPVLTHNFRVVRHPPATA